MNNSITFPYRCFNIVVCLDVYGVGAAVFSYYSEPKKYNEKSSIFDVEGIIKDVSLKTIEKALRKERGRLDEYLRGCAKEKLKKSELDKVFNDVACRLGGSIKV